MDAEREPREPEQELRRDSGFRRARAVVSDNPVLMPLSETGPGDYFRIAQLDRIGGTSKIESVKDLSSNRETCVRGHQTPLKLRKFR